MKNGTSGVVGATKAQRKALIKELKKNGAAAKPAQATTLPKKNAVGRAAHPLTTVIKLLVKDNPKRPSGASYKRFAQYKNGMTIEQYAARVGNNRLALTDIRWDVAHKFIALA